MSILVADFGLVVASGEITADKDFFYSGEFAFPTAQGYVCHDGVELPEGLRPWHCTYVDGVFTEIPEAEEQNDDQ